MKTFHGAKAAVAWLACSLIASACTDVAIGTSSGLAAGTVHTDTTVPADTTTLNTDITVFEPRSTSDGELSETVEGPPFCGDAPDDLAPAATKPASIIFDTDFGPDVDDVGALAVLHTLADLGEAEILGVTISNGGDAAADGAVDVVNTYYGRPDIPIGLVSGPAPDAGSRYTADLVANFEHDIVKPETATSLYRRLLARSPDQSVTIVSVGFLSNLDDLLESPADEFSELDGQELVARKVRLWVAMGGFYPDSGDHPRGRSFNFARDPEAAAIAIEEWPTAAVFTGWEVGSEVWTGVTLQREGSATNPVRRAYELYTGGDARASFDLIAVLYAIRGGNGQFHVCTGRNQVSQDGSNTWVETDGDQGYLKLQAPPDQVAAILDDLLLQRPHRSHTFASFR
jgi:inosine-uridine nucleoside N-ribohydrolase